MTTYYIVLHATFRISVVTIQLNCLFPVNYISYEKNELCVEDTGIGKRRSSKESEKEHVCMRRHGKKESDKEHVCMRRHAKSISRGRGWGFKPQKIYY